MACKPCQARKAREAAQAGARPAAKETSPRWRVVDEAGKEVLGPSAESVARTVAKRYPGSKVEKVEPAAK